MGLLTKTPQSYTILNEPPSPLKSSSLPFLVINYKCPRINIIFYFSVCSLFVLIVKINQPYRNFALRLDTFRIPDIQSMYRSPSREMQLAWSIWIIWMPAVECVSSGISGWMQSMPASADPRIHTNPSIIHRLIKSLSSRSHHAHNIQNPHSEQAYIRTLPIYNLYGSIRINTDM